MESQYTSGDYADKNPSFHAEDAPWKARRIVDMLRSHDLSPESVCEVGCGSGEILARLHAWLTKASLTGYEISPQGYSLCRERQTDRLRYHHADLFESGDGPFDLMLCIDVLEHVADYLGFLERLRSYARQFVFHIPLDMSAQMVLRDRQMYVRQRVGHLHYFSRSTALATLEDAGYAVSDWRYSASGLELAKSTQQRIARAPRRLLFSLAPDLTVRLLGGYSLLVLASPAP